MRVEEWACQPSVSGVGLLPAAASQGQPDQSSAGGVEAAVSADPVDDVGEQFRRQRLAEQRRAQQRAGTGQRAGPRRSAPSSALGLAVSQPAAADQASWLSPHDRGAAVPRRRRSGGRRTRTPGCPGLRASGISIHSRTTTRDTLPPMAIGAEDRELLAVQRAGSLPRRGRRACGPRPRGAGGGHPAGRRSKSAAPVTHQARRVSCPASALCHWSLSRFSSALITARPQRGADRRVDQLLGEAEPVGGLVDADQRCALGGLGNQPGGQLLGDGLQQFTGRAADQAQALVPGLLTGRGNGRPEPLRRLGLRAGTPGRPR